MDNIATIDWVKYGVEGAIFLVAIALFLILSRRLNQQIAEVQSRSDAQEQRLTKQTEQMSGQIKEVLTFLEKVMINTNHVHNAQDEESGRRLDMFITEQLQLLLKDLKCARAYFVTYHNGVWSNSGIRLPKMSISAEAINIGVPSIMPQLQSMPRTFLMSFDSTLEKDGKIYYSNVLELQQSDTMSYSWLHSHGCTKIAVSGIRDAVRGYLVGFIAVEYNTDYPAMNPDKQIELYTNKAAERISGAFQLEHLDNKKGGSFDAEK